MGRTSCQDCVKIWQAYEKPTPCEKCLPPTLEVNRPFLSLYQFISDQLIMGPGGAVGLNFLAVDRAMDYFEVDLDEREEFYRALRTITGVVLGEQYKEQEAKLAAARKKK